ncbi:MAG TPA: hypothetical protein VN673_09565 [Clostridia bacterium]|nr:hypothetical protein [Clostridia bacterium]
MKIQCHALFAAVILTVAGSCLTAAAAVTNQTARVPGRPPRQWTLPPTRDAGPVEWQGDRIVSRVLPYPDFTSFFIRLPIAHAAATGKGVKIAVLEGAESRILSELIHNVAPGAEIEKLPCDAKAMETGQLGEQAIRAGCRVLVLAGVQAWPKDQLVSLARQLTAVSILIAIPSDLSEDPQTVEAVNVLRSVGVLTVGRVDRQSMVMAMNGGERGASRPFNRHIRELHTDVFCATGLEGGPDLAPVAAAAGVAALVYEKWPASAAAEARQKLISGARSVWQATSVETGRLQPSVSVDPVTTRYEPRDEKAIFRFRVLDAAGALGVDTAIPWFLNMLNCQKAWTITRGKGMVAVVSDQGFHLRHPAFTDRLGIPRAFGPLTFEAPEQNFHGTDMSRILLAIAPEAQIVPVLCSAKDYRSPGELAANIAASFRYAAEIKAHVLSASWAGYFRTDKRVTAAGREAVDSGVVVSWFHFPEEYPGLLRSGFVYGVWSGDPLGFADRFLTDPPGFHPVEVEAGLSGTAPQAAAIAALVKSVNPGLSPAQIHRLIIQNATPIGERVRVPDIYQTLLAAKASQKE